MANTTYVDYTATASQTDFAFSFPYLEDEHVIVEINGSATTSFTLVTSPATKVVLNSGTTAGDIVRVRRKSQPDQNLVDFVNGSVLTESELDRAYLHNRYLNEEIGELNEASLQKEAGGTDWDARGSKIKNLGNPTLTSDASTKNYVDAKVNQVSSGASSPPTKWVFTGDSGANTTYSVTGAEVNGDTAYDVSIDGAAQEPTTDYTVDPDTDTLTIVSTLAGGEDIVVIERGFGIALTTGSIGSGSISNGAIITDKIADGAVITDKIADDSISLAKMKANSVDSDQYVDGSIDGVHLASDVVDGTKIADNSIDSEHYVDGSIDSAHIANNQITSAEITDSSSDFNVQSSTGHIGVGISPPASAIHLHGATEAIRISESNVYGGVKWYHVLQSNNRGAWIGADQGATAGTDADIRFAVAAVEQARITSNGQMSIGNVDDRASTTPEGALDVTSTTGGIVFPRMNTDEMNAIVGAPAGTIVYNTTLNKFYGRTNLGWGALH